MFSIIFIRVSLICLVGLNPFWALLMMLSATCFNRLFRARDIILYEQFSRDIGRQFLMEVVFPFFGIRRIAAVLKLGVSVPALKQ